MVDNVHSNVGSTPYGHLSLPSKTKVPDVGKEVPSKCGAAFLLAGLVVLRWRGTPDPVFLWITKLYCREAAWNLA